MSNERNRPVAVVTGGRQGLGRGAALALADRGFDLVLIDLHVDDVASATIAAIQEKGAKAHIIQGDITDTESLATLAQSAWDVFGGVDCMLSNAGIAPQRGSILTMTPEAFDRTMNVNLRGNLFMAQAVARLMVEEETSSHYRSMIFISSIAAEHISVGMADYSISKSALSTVSQAFGLTLAKYGIQVHEVRPGFIRTEMTMGDDGSTQASVNRRIEAGAIPMNRWGEEADVGKTVATLASGDLPFTTAHPIYADGGFLVFK